MEKPLDFSDWSLVDLEKLVMCENWFKEIVNVEDNAEEFIDVATFLKDKVRKLMKLKKIQTKLKKETKIVREYSSYKNLDQIIKLQKLKHLEIVGQIMCLNINFIKTFLN